MMSRGAKNALGQEAFGSKASVLPVVESPVASTADVTSTAAIVGTTAALEADKAGTSAPPLPGVGATTLAPLIHGRRQARGGSSMRVWNQ
jgi:hypothetical protein